LEELNKEGGPRDAVEAQSKVDASQGERTLVALDLLLISVMCKEVIPGKTIPEMELAVKRFLTELDLLDQQVKKKSEKARVVSVHNFLCLLNLPELTRRYGPLRNLWEGGWKGEGVVPESRTFVNNGKRKNFLYNGLVGVHREAAYAYVLEGNNTHGGRTGSLGSPGTWQHFLEKHKTGIRNFLVYRSNTPQKALSVIVLHEEGHETLRVFAAIPSGRSKEDGDGTNVALCEVIAVPETSHGGHKEVRLGLEYRGWHQEGAELGVTVEFGVLPPPNERLVSFGVLLPLMNGSTGPALHTLITSDRYTY
jgi:hypothetical protein